MSDSVSVSLCLSVFQAVLVRVCGRVRVPVRVRVRVRFPQYFQVYALHRAGDAMVSACGKQVSIRDRVAFSVRSRVRDVWLGNVNHKCSVNLSGMVTLRVS